MRAKRAPGPTVLQALRALRNRDLLATLTAMHAEHGDVAGFYHIGKSWIMLRDPQHIEHVLVANNDNYRKAYDYTIPKRATVIIAPWVARAGLGRERGPGADGDAAAARRSPDDPDSAACARAAGTGIVPRSRGELMMRLDIADIVGRIQQQISNVTGNAKTAGDLLEILRDAHRVLLKIETMVDRLDGTVREWESKLSKIEVSPERLARLEKAVFNIERATMGVEATMGSLPRALRTRIERRRQPAAGDTLPDWDQPGMTPEPNA